jgi:hypothetical protein
MGLAGMLGGLAPASASVPLPPLAQATAVSTPGGFMSLTPSRLLNTLDGVGAPKAAVAASGTVHLQVTGRGGVPVSGISAVVLNVAVVAPTSAGYITVYGAGTTRPGASNLTFVKAQTVPNLVIAPVGANGMVDLYNGSAGTVQLVADVSGYFLSGTPTEPGAFGSLAPFRLLNTLAGVGAPKAAVAAGGKVRLQVTGRGGVPVSGVSAVVLNVAVVAPTSAGYITVYGAGTTRPGASNLNFVKAQTVPNLVIAPVGAGGVVDLYNGSNGTVQLVADVSGYFLSGTPEVAGAFGSLAPSRLLNTLAGVGAPKVAVAAGGTVHLQVTGRGGVPATGVSAAVLNVAVVAPTSAGYITVYGAGTTRPGASNLNFVKGQTVPNLVIAPVGAGGVVDLYNGSNGTVQLVADVSGWFMGTNAVLTPVSNVSATPNSTSIALSWTNPTDVSLTGVMIRRALGSIPPASATSGDEVTDAVAPQISFTDTALISGTRYTYSFFAHNGAAVYAAAATITVFTTAAGSGNVSGTVTDAGGTPHGLAHVDVQVGAVHATTATDGSYTATGLAAGTYVVCFAGFNATGGSSEALGYIDQCYNGQARSGTPTTVTVTSGLTTTGIDASMVEKGAITGTVTDVAGSLSGVSRFAVTVTSPSTGASGSAIAFADGSYTTRGIPPAPDYRVCFEGISGQKFVEECYDNQPTSGTSTPVAVTSGATTTGINAALTAWGKISGTVTDAGDTDQGLANVDVMISSASTGAFGGATTAADGTYTAHNLPSARDYKVCYFVNGVTGGLGDAAGYINQCYANQPISGTPTPVTVTNGVTVTGVNAALVRGGALSGTVTEAGGSLNGLEHVLVQVSSKSTGAREQRLTDPDGSYTVTGLAAGTDYMVCFDGSRATGGSSDPTGYVDRCWQDQPTLGTPTPVSLSTGATTTGIGAALAGNP